MCVCVVLIFFFYIYEKILGYPTILSHFFSINTGFDVYIPNSKVLCLIFTPPITDAIGNR